MIYSDNQFLTVSSLLYDSIQIAITEKASLWWDFEQSLIFILDTAKCEHAWGASGETRMDEWYIFRTVLVFLYEYFFYLQYYSKILMASLPFLPLNTVPYYQQH